MQEATTQYKISIAIEAKQAQEIVKVACEKEQKAKAT